MFDMRDDEQIMRILEAQVNRIVVWTMIAGILGMIALTLYAAWLAS